MEAGLCSSAVCTYKRGACLSCQVDHPANGKILDCFHVVCGDCLRDGVTRSGCFECLLCGTQTSVRFPGSSLEEDLLSAQFWLYPRRSFTDVPGIRCPNVLAELAPCDATQNTRYQCETCDDDLVKEIAVCFCRRCNNRPLCRVHADIHVKRRAFSSHSLEDISRLHTLMSPSRFCQFHTEWPILSFCLTCKVCICQLCLRSTAHDGHAVQSIGSAATKHREALRMFRWGQTGLSLLATADINSAASTTRDPQRSIGHLEKANLVKVEEHLEIVQMEKARASQDIADRIKLVKQLVIARKSVHLQHVIHTSRCLERALERRLLQFESLREQLTTIVAVANQLQYAGLSHPVVIRTTQFLHRVLHGLPDCLNNAGPRFIRFVPKEQDGTVLRNIIEHIGAARKFARPDFSQCQLSISRIPLEFKVWVAIHLYDSKHDPIPRDRPISDIKVTLRCTETGERWPVEVLDASERDGSVLRFPINMCTSGGHELDFSLSGRLHSMELEAIPPSVLFNTGSYAFGVKISDSGRRAIRTKYPEQQITEPILPVLGAIGYTSGIHSWHISTDVFTPGNDGMVVGICRAPTWKVSRDTAFSVRGDGAYWWDNGRAKVDGSSAPGKRTTSGFRPEDTLTLTLDCEARTLQFKNHRTNESDILRQVDCKQQMYPMVVLFRLGDTARIC